MLLRFNYLLFILLLASQILNSSCDKLSTTSSFQYRLDSLSTAYQDSLKAQHGGLTSNFIKKWGNQYWELAKENPNHQLAPQAARKAFEIYQPLKRPGFYLEKLNELSIHTRAMSGIIPYWDAIVWSKKAYPQAKHPYPKKLQDIVEESQSKEVQIAAHFHLAKWFVKNKYYGRASRQLDILQLTYQIYPTDKQYGNDVQAMLTEIGKFAAGQEVPHFQTEMLSGKTVNQSDLKNKVTFFYFYNSYCGACINMYPEITKVYQKYKDQGFQVVGFADDWKSGWGFSTPEEFKKFAEKYDVKWPQSVEYDMWEKLDVSAASTGFLIDQQGKIVRISHSNEVSDATLGFGNTSLKEAVAKLLNRGL